MEDRNATIVGPYTQRSIRARLEAFFLDNLGKVATREQLIEVATDPVTGRQPENWHQRLSELRTDKGYTILSWRNRGDLKVSEYIMPNGKGAKRHRNEPAQTQLHGKRCWYGMIVVAHGRKAAYRAVYGAVISTLSVAEQSS